MRIQTLKAVNVGRGILWKCCMSKRMNTNSLGTRPVDFLSAQHRDGSNHRAQRSAYIHLRGRTGCRSRPRLSINVFVDGVAGGAGTSRGDAGYARHCVIERDVHTHTHTHAQLIRDAGPNSSTPLFRQDVMEGSEKDPMGSESPPGYGEGFHSSVIAAFSTPPIPIDTNPFHMNPNPNHRIQTKGALGYKHSHD